MATEKTVVKVMTLKDGRPYVWLPQLNVVVVSDKLTEAEVETALTALQDEWRRDLLRRIPPARASRRRPIGFAMRGNRIAHTGTA